MPAILAIDQGTTGSTALVVSDGAQVLGRGYREFPQHFPQPGWVEHEPEEIWQSVLAAAHQAIAAAGQMPDVLGITNQRETVLAWERATGRPVHRALVWQDRRTAQRCRELEAELGPSYIAERTGLIWDPYFSGSKIEWMLREIPGLRERAERGEVVFGTVDTWLIHRLTDGLVFVTDHTNASRTLLYNLRTRTWDPQLLSLFGIPARALPLVQRSAGVLGVADKRHFGAAMRVAGVAGDQQAALWGQGCWTPGQAKCTYGTGAFLLMLVGEVAPGKPAERSRLVRTVACGPDGEPVAALEGSIFVAGAAVQWLRDGLGLIASAEETEALARTIPDTGGVYFVPALAGLGAPYWDAEARGTLVGITRGTTRGHVVRAALEAMAYQVRDVVEQVRKETGVALCELKVDGGAAANGWLMQFQADVVGARVGRPDIVETTALGAAGLAGIGAGVWSGAEEFLQARRYQWFEPKDRNEDGYAGWRRAVAAALSWSAARPGLIKGP